MKAKIIAVLNCKGGSAKTSVCMAISASLSQRGNRVLVVDSDTQGSSLAWSAAAGKIPFPATVISLASYGAKIHRELQRHVENYDYILVDTPPSLEAPVNQSVLCVAALCIIAQQSSPTDLWAARGVKTLIEFARTINPDLKACMVLTRVVRTSLSKAIMRELESFGFPILATRMHNRTAYQEAAIAGSGVTTEALGRDAKAAADEVSGLTEEVLALLGDAS